MSNTYLLSDETRNPVPRHQRRLLGQKPQLKPKEVWAIRIRLQIKEKQRDLALFNLAIDSKLRSCDLVALRDSDIFMAGSVRDRAVIVQKKTGNLRAVQLLLGHTKLESTVRYLGIEVDDALQISEQVEL